MIEEAVVLAMECMLIVANETKLFITLITRMLLCFQLAWLFMEAGIYLLLSKLSIVPLTSDQLSA